MSTFLQYIVSGLAAGGLYAIASLGLTLVYRTTSVVNFAHGELAMVGTFAAFLVSAHYSTPYFVTVGAGLACATILGILVERGLMRPLQGSDHLRQLIITLGVFMLLRGAMGTRFLDTEPFPRPIEGGAFSLGGVFIGRENLLILGLTAVIALAGHLFFKYSMVGISLRATAQDLFTARLVGIPINIVYLTTWAVASALAVIAGMLIAPTSGLSPDFMGEFSIKAFAAAVLGGLGSMPGAIVGGLLLGVLENLIVGYMSSEIKAVFSFTLILLVLVLRPQGIMGEPLRRQV